MKTTPRISVNVGITLPDRDNGVRNKQDLSEHYAAHVSTQGFRAFLRNDALEGRRFQLFLNRVSDQEYDRLRNERSRSVSRLRNLERRGLMFEAIFDLIPSLFSSGWRLLPSRRRYR
ncbi:MAG: hypothetical protein IPM23_17005 [Candidatus Melainabacteria bacterium]|nr:hypothetical protein [Candidatus Melainabacteria bacterium]